MYLYRGHIWLSGKKGYYSDNDSLLIIFFGLQFLSHDDVPSNDKGKYYQLQLKLLPFRTRAFFLFMGRLEVRFCEI